MRPVLTLLVLSSTAFAQTLPVGYDDLSPAKQAELIAAWKKNYKTEISALPPGQKPQEKPSAPPKPPEPESVKLPPPKPVVQPKPVEVPQPLSSHVVQMPYADIKAKVDKGEVVYMAVIPEGYLQVDPADAKKYGLQPGLWKCWKQGDKNYMAPVAGELPLRSVQKTPSGRIVQATHNHYGHPENLDAHLTEEHGVSPAQLQGLTLEQKKSLHDRKHVDMGGPPTPAYRGPQQAYPPTFQQQYPQYQPAQRPPVLPYAPVPNLQNIFRPGGVGGMYQPGCKT